MLAASSDLNVVWDGATPAGLPRRIPPVVIADPDRGGTATDRIISQMREGEGRTALVIYSYGATLDDLRHAFELGAHGYVLKSDPVEVLRLAVQTLPRASILSRRGCRPACATCS
jgi:DNA-binding NarL/FixJ family response regulator